jgi:hypothetical protein
MDTLTISLAALGGVVLAGVIAHGAWQARNAGPRRAEVDPDRPEPREPVMDAAIDSVLPEVVDLPEGVIAERRLAPRGAARIDALIDAVATLGVDAPMSGDSLMAHLPPTRRAGGKPFIIEGLNAEYGEWEPLEAGRRYSELQAGVLLANRTGALNEIEYSEFVQKVQAFADAVGANPDFPDMLDVVARARELDAFASQHDAQLAVRLRSRNAAWSVAFIQQHGGKHGFVPGVVPGRFVLPSAEAGAPPVLTLTFASQAALADEPDLAAVREVTLSFDVPQTDPSVQPFEAWQQSAQALAASMEAFVVDDKGQMLAPESFAAIGGELGQLYEALAKRDVAAGSTAARRLFS